MKLFLLVNKRALCKPCPSIEQEGRKHCTCIVYWQDFHMSQICLQDSISLATRQLVIHIEAFGQY